MSDTSHFRTVTAWKEALGLLPVRLRYDEENSERFVLLNGSRGNFCLDFVGAVDPRSQRAAAWSCDVGHYITCTGDSISVNRWDRNSPEERFSGKSVFGQIHEFHRYLEKNTPDQSKSLGNDHTQLFARGLVRICARDSRDSNNADDYLHVDDLAAVREITKWLPFLRCAVRRTLKNDFPDHYLPYLNEDGSITHK